MSSLDHSASALGSLGPPPGPADTERVYDYCVVGSGASGSVAADVLVRAGYDVLVLEQGPFLDAGVTYDEVLAAAERAYAREPNGCWGLVGYPWTTCNVGGGMSFYGGASFRMRRVDFAASEHFRVSDLPVCWPFDYDVLAPWYDRIEETLGLAAEPTLDPTHPGGSVRHVLPPLPTTPEADALWAAAERLGLHPFPTPMAVLSRPRPARAACRSCSPCIEHRCSTGARLDPYEHRLRPHLGNPRFRLLAGLKAVCLERDTADRVAGIVVMRTDDGSTHRFSAKTFLLAANAIQTAALLLRSRDAWSPAGIGNEHDLVGRGLCFKLSEYVLGYLRGGSVLERLGGPFSTFAITDHYLDEAAPGGMGGLVYEAAHGFRAPRAEGERFLRLECLLADEPSRRNRVRLSSDTDRHGIPRLMLDYTPHPRDLFRLEHLVERASSLLREAGATHVLREPSGWAQGSCHLHGTCRANADPRHGVVDPDGRVHSVSNVYVIDGAFMPFPGGVGPTLTIQANALRIASTHAGIAPRAPTTEATT
jgi:choline dehydrogenase-like flavoprotein